MKMPTFKDYQKDNGDWFRELPSHWSSKRAKWVFDSIRDRSRDGDTQLAASQKHGVIPQKLMMEMNNASVMQAIKGTDNFKRVKKNDFVISLRSFEGGIEISHYDGCISPAYTVLRLSSKQNNDPGYFRYALKESFFIQALNSTSEGIRDGKTITYDQFCSLNLCIPPLEEQKAISCFLNREIKRIDSLIDEKQSFINLLKEKRQALISQVVTKGLDSDVEMKDSDLLWAPKIPAHWSVKKISYICKMQSGDSITSEGIEETGSYPVFGGNGVRGYCESYNHSGDYILIGRQGSLCGNINYASGKFFASEHAVVVYPEKNIVMKWLGETLRAMDLIQYSVSAAIPGLSVSNILQLKVPHPPESEQLRIARHIQSQTNYIDKLIDEVNVSVDLLKEHRTALISAAVTGKIDLRDKEVA